jgi:Tol biopolymer transport system component
VISSSGKLIKSFFESGYVTSVAWLPDNSGLFFIADALAMGYRGQVWFQPYPNGAPSKVSNDLSSYGGYNAGSLSVTADGDSLLVTQTQWRATTYVGETPPVLNDKAQWRFVPISTEQAGGNSLSWTGDARLIQDDLLSRLYLTAADGTNRVRILGDGLNVWATACGSKDAVVLVRILKEKSPGLWRLNSFTGEAAEIPNTTLGDTPSCTPDGQSIVFLELGTKDGIRRILRISTKNSALQELDRGMLMPPTISPDGKFVAYRKDDVTNGGFRFIVKSLDGGAPLREIEGPSSFSEYRWLSWSPDGRALTFVQPGTNARSDQLFMLPLSGDHVVQLTHFDSEPMGIAAYAWSRDGKKLAISRYPLNDTDAVMFSGFR